MLRSDRADTRATPASFSPDCSLCPRLVAYRTASRAANPAYYGRAVASFGPATARLLIVGLAPGLHGANATGRPFTGDHAGVTLYAALHRFGFSSRPVSTAADDDLRLRDCRITNAVRCVPPANRPLPAEVRTCNGFLRAELARLPAGAIVLTLGRIAHDAVLLALGQRPGEWPFGHGNWHEGPTAGESRLSLVDSYHCSRYNTQTGRLTPAMFHAVLGRIARRLESRTARNRPS